ncbi:MAG: cell division protein FtsZ [Fimbriimonadaceae bacterium]|nr:MAG: cell division protein FtsZ [Fimbriimonadaceae bacterium]
MSPLNLFESRAVIKVVGVGGAGCNAVERMVEAGVGGVSFVAVNTDRQVLERNPAETLMVIGGSQTRGLGAGGDPTRGEQAAKDSERALVEMLEGADLVFVTAGMGGGTGTGAAPVIAELARRMDILTVGVVTRPFAFEGPKRSKVAHTGLERMRAACDTLIVVPNENLMGVVERSTSLSSAFKVADDVLRQGVQGISDIVTRPGLINVDFNDVRAVLKDAGVALMGIGTGIGEERARVAAQAAATSPLLDTRINSAKRMLVSITAGPDFSIGEVSDAMAYLARFTHVEDANVFLGHVVDEGMGETVQVTILAAGFEEAAPEQQDRSMFLDQAPQRTNSDEQVARTRREAPPIEIEDLDLNIPSFLRRVKSGG